MNSTSALEHAPETASAGDLLHARYGNDKMELPPAWNETLAVLLSHRSTRAYLPKLLPEGTLELIVAAAQSASTSSNLQAWSVVAVTDPARKKKLAEFAGNQKHIEEAPLFLVFLADLSRLGRAAARQGITPEATDFLETFLIAVVDAALAAQNAVVALEALGLGSVYIGAMRNRPEEVAALLGLPPQAFAVFGLCIGYPDPAKASAVKPRLPQPSVLHRERYSIDGEAPALAAYDQDLRQFQKRQGMPEADWTQFAVERVKDAAALRGRDRLGAILAALSFPLR